MRDRMDWFLQTKQCALEKKLGKGHAAETYLVSFSSGKKAALKIEKKNSTRKHMIEKEAAHLKEANQKGIGPTLYGYNKEQRLLWMEYVEGKTLAQWLDENQGVQTLRALLNELFRQASVLDGIGLDHGQLAGRGRNILVREDNTPCIIDFEKASLVRKPHNQNQLKSFLLDSPHGKIAKQVRSQLAPSTARRAQPVHGIPQQEHGA